MLLLLLQVLASELFGQPAVHHLGTSQNDFLSDVTTTQWNRYLAVGSKWVNGRPTLWLVKFASNGEVLFEKTYASPVPETDVFGYSIKKLSDGNFLLLGEQNPDHVFDDENAVAVKINANGDVIWKRSYGIASGLADAVVMDNGNMFCVGWEYRQGNRPDGIVLILAPNGNVVKKYNIDHVADNTSLKRVFATSDGNFILLGRSEYNGSPSGSEFYRKITPDGEQIWQTLANAGYEEYYGFSSEYLTYHDPFPAVQMPDGSIWAAHVLLDNHKNNVVMHHVHDDGTIIEKREYGSPAFFEYPTSLLTLPDGGFLISGTAYEDNGVINPFGFALRINANGLQDWGRYYGNEEATDRLLGSAMGHSGNFLMVGTSRDTLKGLGGYDGWCLAADADGEIKPWSVKGRVLVDMNNNCLADSSDVPARGWLVKMDGVASRLTTTDLFGRFYAWTDENNVGVSALPPGNDGSWTTCAQPQWITLGVENTSEYLTLLVQPGDVICAKPEVVVTQPELQRCSSSMFIATVRNSGMQTSESLVLKIKTDPALEITGSSMPYEKDGQVLLLELPPIKGQQAIFITFDVLLHCNVQLGATHRIDAVVEPLTCLAEWEGPDYHLSGTCNGNDVVFSLINLGGGGSDAETQYRILSDHLIAVDWTPVVLPEGAPAHQVTFPADGRTWRVEMKQALGHPSKEPISDAVEACGQLPNGLFTTGHANAWRTVNGNSHTEITWVSNTTGTPNRISNVVGGYGNYRNFDSLQPLEYTARVRNPLLGQANTVVFYFTFSKTYDLQTFELVASNKPATLKFDDLGILRITMTDMALDSGDYAMLRFRIKPIDTLKKNDGYNSLLQVYGNAVIDGTGPYGLFNTFNNYYDAVPIYNDPYNEYPEGVTLLGGKFSDFGAGMENASDGSVFLYGTTSSFSDRTNEDGWLIKLDETGKCLWMEAFDLGQQQSNGIKGIVALPDGGCLVVGGTVIRPDVQHIFINHMESYLLRVDASGKVLWQKTFNPAENGHGSIAQGIESLNDGHFIIYGTATNDSDADPYYIRCAPDGTFLNTYYNPTINGVFIPRKAAVTSDGNVVVMGADETYTGQNYDIQVVKLNAEAEVMWTKKMNGQENIYYGGIVPLNDGGFMVNGYSQWKESDNTFVTGPVFVRYNAQGIRQWTKKLTVGPYRIARINNIIVDPNGGILSVGSVFMDTLNQGTDVLLLKTDENADSVIWWKSYGSKSHDQAKDALVTSGNKVFLWGHNQARGPLYNLQSVLVHTDLLGELASSIQMQPPLTARALVHPNPAENSTRVVLPENFSDIGNFEWTVVDWSGRVVLIGLGNNGTCVIEAKSLPQGIYSIHFPNLKLSSEKLMIIR